MMTIMVGKTMTSTWTAEQRDRYSAGLTIFSPKTPLHECRHRRNLHFPVGAPGRQILLSEWQAKASYLSLAANVDEDDRRFCDGLLERTFLRTEDRNRLEEIWHSCRSRD
jgi:hypothetical protein